MLSEHDRENIGRIITDDYGDWFTAHLLRLCHKADARNLERLRQAFPEVVAAYGDWLYNDQEGRTP